MKSRSIGDLIGRALLSTIFIASGVAKFQKREANLDYMESRGLPRSRPLLDLAATAEVGLGTAVLTGAATRPLSLALGLYLIPVTLIFHNFWKQEGERNQIEMINFLKNLSLIGGLTILASRGSHRLSVDHAVSRAIRGEGSGAFEFHSREFSPRSVLDTAA